MTVPSTCIRRCSFNSCCCRDTNAAVFSACGGTTGATSAGGRDDQERGRNVLKVENESLGDIGVGSTDETVGIEVRVEGSNVG
jgi:hypothetical protein